MEGLMPEQDQWRSSYQQLLLAVYERWMKQLRRLALVNGISAEAFDRDSKFDATMGPRVHCYEILTILLERSDDGALRV